MNLNQLAKQLEKAINLNKHNRAAHGLVREAVRRLRQVRGMIEVRANAAQ